MPQITAIKPQTKAGYFNVFIAGEYAFSLDEVGLLSSGISKGDELSAAAITKLKKLAAQTKLFNSLLRYVGLRPRSQKEIEDYLQYRKKVSATTTKALVAKLTKLGLIDDRAFTKWWVEQRTNQKKGEYVIIRELALKGIKERDVREMFGEVGGDVLTDISSLVRKKKQQLQSLPRKEQHQKLAAFLMRRGYPWEQIKQVLEQEL